MIIRGARYRLRYDRPGEPGDRDRHAAADMALAKRVSETLMAHYPGHLWMVHADHGQGIIQIKLPILMGAWCFVVKIADLKGDPSMRAVLRAGGEILERYRIPRSGIDMDAFRTVLAQQPMILAHARPPGG